jgi:hypothetical protein
MTDNQIKEAISEAFIRLILAHDEFKIYKSDTDHGIDLNVGPVDITTLSNGDIMYEDSDRRLDIQLKSTTKAGVEFKDGFVEYSLRNKNYLTLKKKVDSPYIKMILIVFVLPEDKKLWMDVFEDNILLRKHCFWFIPNDSVVPANIRIKGKNYPVKIKIPLENHLLKNFRLVYNKINGI